MDVAVTTNPYLANSNLTWTAANTTTPLTLVLSNPSPVEAARDLTDPLAWLRQRVEEMLWEPGAA